MRESSRSRGWVLSIGANLGAVALAVATCAAVPYAGAVMASKPIAPGAPKDVTARPGTSAAVVRWTAPRSNGGSAITGYTVTSKPGSKTCTPSPATVTTCTVTGLTNGTAYTFTVRARNSVGTGPASAASKPVTPAALPGAPTNVTGTRGNAEVTVRWTAPSSNGGSAITGYTVTSKPGSKTCTPSPATVTTCTVTGLTNNSPYTFTVTATNAVGAGAASAPSAPVTPIGPPGPPTDVAGIAGNQRVTVSWTAPPDNGSPITSYYVSANDAVHSCTATTTTSCTVRGLTNGTAYTFTVTATSAVGTGPASAASLAVTPAAVPGAPTSVAGTSGNGQVTVSWTAPPDNGSPITSYTATANDGVHTCTTATTSCTVTGLTNGTAYTFTVTATNGEGTGAASAASLAVTPSTVPDAPTGVTAVAGNGQATASWSPPFDEGSSITSYTVTATGDGNNETCTYTVTTPETDTCTVTGLTNGTGYTFTVTATNANGPGTASAASDAVVPDVVI